MARPSDPKRWIEVIWTAFWRSLKNGEILLARWRRPDLLVVIVSLDDVIDLSFCSEVPSDS